MVEEIPYGRYGQAHVKIDRPDGGPYINYSIVVV